MVFCCHCLSLVPRHLFHYSKRELHSHSASAFTCHSFLFNYKHILLCGFSSSQFCLLLMAARKELAFSIAMHRHDHTCNNIFVGGELASLGQHTCFTVLSSEHNSSHTQDSAVPACRVWALWAPWLLAFPTEGSRRGSLDSHLNIQPQFPRIIWSLVPNCHKVSEIE